MKTILVTGGAGFIGANFVRILLAGRQARRVVNFDALTYAGNLENLAGLEKDPRHVFVRGDIREASAVAAVFRQHDVAAVVNFAAESHVDRSIEGPGAFIETNVRGTGVLLEAALGHWRRDPGDKYCREFRPGVKFLQVSTDEVYGTLGATGRFTEATPLAPNSPYAATKAAADLLVRAWHETYGLPVNITRCSNNYGPYQFPEKLIPLLINNCLHDRELPVYGDGRQVRDWLHAADHCAALAAVLERGRDGEVYNIGGNCEKANIEIVRLVLAALDKPETLIRHVRDRPGHDRRYAIDNTKITRELGWRPGRTFEAGLEETIAWYRDHREWMARVVSGAYRGYYQRMYGPRGAGG